MANADAVVDELRHLAQREAVFGQRNATGPDVMRNASQNASPGMDSPFRGSHWRRARPEPYRPVLQRTGRPCLTSAPAPTFG
jgi:hypothetical protein